VHHALGGPRFLIARGDSAGGIKSVSISVDGAYQMQGKNSTHIVVTGCDAAIEEGILVLALCLMSRKSTSYTRNSDEPVLNQQYLLGFCLEPHFRPRGECLQTLSE
jgi:hypothetical protein